MNRVATSALQVAHRVPADQKSEACLRAAAPCSQLTDRHLTLAQITLLIVFMMFISFFYLLLSFLPLSPLEGTRYGVS